MSSAKRGAVKKNETHAPGKGAQRASSPVDALDVSDPGDETQRNFRYQHAYGVILLVQASIGRLPYVAVWCEQHEDFLAERSDGRYDGWQIKTRTPENGPWKLLDDGLVRSIARFCDLVDQYQDNIGRLIFASNVKGDSVTTASTDQKRRGRCPQLFLDHIQACDSRDEIDKTFVEPFDDLVAQTATEETKLLEVLKRVELQLGPGKADFDAVLAHDHLGRLPECRSFSPAQLAQARDELIRRVFEACSLKVTDGARHVVPSRALGLENPALAAKRIPIEELQLVIAVVNNGATYPIARDATLVLGQNRAVKGGAVLAKKLSHGGLDADQIEDFETLARSAERHLMFEATRNPETFPQMKADLESAVLLRCRQAYLRAKQMGAPFGEQMMIAVQDSLANLAESTPTKVWKQTPECLVGVAALLTDDCKIWFSPRFMIDETAGETA